MTYKKQKQYRLKNFDYSCTGYYFVTICTYNRLNYFGDIVEGKIRLSKIGEIALKCWKEIPNHCDYVLLDNFTIMPNHIHGIIVIANEDVENNCRNVIYYVPTEKQNVPAEDKNKYFSSISTKSKTLGSIVRSYKSATQRECNKKNLSFKWQSRFYDHIIRNQNSLDKIRNYIEINQAKWEFDELYLK